MRNITHDAIRATLVAALLCSHLFFSTCARANNDVAFFDGAIASFESGHLKLKVNGLVVWNKNLKKNLKKSKATLVIHTMNDNTEALHLIVDSDKSEKFEAVAVRRGSAHKLKIVWKADTALKGDVGERSKAAVRFEDLTGDGKPEIIVGTVWESLNLCGQKVAPLLFRKAYDPGRHKFRTIAARRPGLKKPVEIEGEVNPKENPGTPLVRIVNPSGVSSLAGDNNDPLFLMPPHALVDGNTKTAWIPGNVDSAGEFATFDAATTAYGIVKIGLRSLPEGERASKYKVPESLLFTSDKKVYRLRFPTSAKADETVWFQLPEPLRSSCFSLVVESTRGATGTPLAITELVLLSEVDTAEGLDRLARDLSDNKKGQQALGILLSLGERSVAPVKKAWKKLNVSGRRRAVNLLAEAAPKQSIKILAEAAVGNDEASITAASKGLARAGDAGVMALVTFLSSKLNSRFEKAAQLLARMKTPKALAGLISAMGKGTADRRRLLRKVVSVSANSSDTHGQLLWNSIENAKEKADKERLLDLLRSAGTVRHLDKQVSSLAVAMFNDADNFNDRYRLLVVIASVNSDKTKAALLNTAGDSDKIIRRTALLGLAGYQNDPKVQAALHAALDDKAVEVRSVALRALSLRQLKDASVNDKIVSLSSSDPWPVIRSRTMSMTTSLPASLAANMIVKGTKDKSRMVRTAAIKSAAKLPDNAITVAINNVLSNPNEDYNVLIAAADSAGMRCEESAISLLAKVLKRGAEPLAADEQKQVAVAAARAMGAIGGKQTAKLLKKIRDRSNPTTDRVIDEALKKLGTRCKISK